MSIFIIFGLQRELWMNETKFSRLSRYEMQQRLLLINTTIEELKRRRRGETADKTEIAAK